MLLDDVQDFGCGWFEEGALVFLTAYTGKAAVEEVVVGFQTWGVDSGHFFLDDFAHIDADEAFLDILLVDSCHLGVVALDHVLCGFGVVDFKLDSHADFDQLDGYLSLGVGLDEVVGGVDGQGRLVVGANLHY